MAETMASIQGDCMESQELLKKGKKHSLDTNQNVKNVPIIEQVDNDKSIDARTVLWYLSFVGFAINYMQRINLNIAVVGMIKIASNKTSGTPFVAYCSNQTSNLSINFDANISETITKLNEDAGMNEHFSPERMILDFFKVDYDRDGFAWDEYEQGVILGSFFWLHWALQVPGGILARMYGTKIVFGVGNFVGCLLCSLMPIASYLDYKFLITIRIIQGIILGGMWPSMHNMVGKWIPPNERSTFMSSYMGSSVGVSIFFPLFGYIMEAFRWEWVFHLCTLLGTLWFIFWQYFVYDSPAQHPRISAAERFFIEDALSLHVDPSNKAPTPWLDIIKSSTIWVNVFSLTGSAWCFYTLMTQAPTYFALIHGWNLKMSGLLSGLPHFLRCVFAYVFSIWCDWLIKGNKLSRNKTRIMALVTCNGLVGVFTIFLGYSGCNSSVAIIFFSIALILTGTVTSGPMASFVDISPNFASILLGIGTMIAILPGFISPLVVGKLTLNNQTTLQWEYVFIISGVIGIVTSIVYAIFSDSSVQYWNNTSNYKKDTEQNEFKLSKTNLKEMEKLQPSNENVDTTNEKPTV